MIGRFAYIYPIRIFVRMRQTSQFLNAIQQISVCFEPFQTLEPRGGSIAARFELVPLVFKVIYFRLKLVSTISARL